MIGKLNYNPADPILKWIWFSDVPCAIGYIGKRNDAEICEFRRHRLCRHPSVSIGDCSQVPQTYQNHECSSPLYKIVWYFPISLHTPDMFNTISR